MEIQGLSFGVNPINKKENIFGDDIAFVKQYDFSRANLSQEHRIHAISAVASICYQNPKAVGSESLYNRLMAESMGLPSSSYEFVPVLISDSEYWDRVDTKLEDRWCNLPLTKYGEWINHKGRKYLLTNYRAVVYTKELYPDIDLTHFFNTQEECNIIQEYFKVFLFKVDFPTRSQMVRHRVSWQELSRRYVSGSRVPFEFYVSERLKKNQKVQDLIKQSEDLYFELLEKGVKPQEARRVIPQSAYTQIWGAFMPNQLDNYFKLRLDKHAQWEIQMVSKAMQELINGRK